MNATKLTYANINSADLETLTDELAAAGWDSTQRDVYAARDAVARLLHETQGPFGLYDSETHDLLRSATADEAAASVNETPDSLMLVDARRCYVAPTIVAGRRIVAGSGENRDSGVVDSVAGNQATVRWDSGVVTTQSIAALLDGMTA